MKAKKAITTVLLSLGLVSAMAVPAKRSWKVVTQSDGTTLKLALTGDEYLHYYVTEDNVPVYRAADNKYCYLTVQSGQLVPTQRLAHEVGLRSVEEQAVVVTPESLAPVAAARRSAARSMCVRARLLQHSVWIARESPSFRVAKRPWSSWPISPTSPFRSPMRPL